MAVFYAVLLLAGLLFFGWSNFHRTRRAGRQLAAELRGCLRREKPCAPTADAAGCTASTTCPTGGTITCDAPGSAIQSVCQATADAVSCWFTFPCGNGVCERTVTGSCS